MKIDKEKIVFCEKRELPDTIKYKRSNILLILLGYVFAVIAGINGAEGIHDILYNLSGYLYMGWINRIVAVVQILCIYWLCRWSFAYAWGKEYTPDENGVGVYEHPKYDSFTRVNGVCILFIFLTTAVCYGCTLNWNVPLDIKL